MVVSGICTRIRAAPRVDLFRTSTERVIAKKLTSDFGGAPCHARAPKHRSSLQVHLGWGGHRTCLMREHVLAAPALPAFKRLHYSTSGTKHVVKLPPLAESISSGTVFSIDKPVGSAVAVDDVVVVIETEKIQVEVRSPHAGVIESVSVGEGDTVEVGKDLFVVVEGEAPPSAPKEEVRSESPPPTEKAAPPTEKPPTSTPRKPEKPSTSQKATYPTSFAGPVDRTDTRIRMTQARKRTAIRLKESQNIAAQLTTFNEVDMSALIDFRNRYKERFVERYGVKLGFMSAFAKASAAALTEIPIVNATLDGDELVYHNYVDISVAVSTPTSLVVPVLRNVERMSFDQIEDAINLYARKARDNKLTIDDMSGGTFTISNGGVFGSLMGTPIINPPQSAILGMHATNNRPIAINDAILIRPLMYLALTYDHRIIDGRDAVTFLKRIKTLVEDPVSLLLGV